MEPSGRLGLTLIDGPRCSRPPGAGPRPRGAVPEVTAILAGAPHSAALSPASVLGLQRTIGNAAVTSIVRATAAPMGAGGAPVVQRVPDPKGLIEATLKLALEKIYRENKGLSDIPTPGRFGTTIVSIIAEAATKEDAYAAFAKKLAAYVGDAKYNAWAVGRFLAMVEASEKAAANERATRKRELTEAKQAESLAPPSKRARVDNAEQVIRSYSTEEKELVGTKLGQDRFHDKLFFASRAGYGALRGQARPAVATHARYNTLGELAQSGPLHSSDLASVHASYTHSRLSPGLVLEVFEEFNISMSQGGGQEIHQLGPYLPTLRKKSVQEDIKAILKNSRLTSPELGAAIAMSDPKAVRRFLEKKGVERPHRLKVRALRQLLGVEKSRGPEVAGATAMEHRSTMHGYSHMADYPSRTPLGPEEATTKLRVAREKGSGQPMDFAYLPAETRDRAVGSTTRFVTSFMNSPRPDLEVAQFVDAVISEPLDGEPSAQLTSSMADVLRTPSYNPWEEFDEDPKDPEQGDSVDATTGDVKEHRPTPEPVMTGSPPTDTGGRSEEEEEEEEEEEPIVDEYLSEPGFDTGADEHAGAGESDGGPLRATACEILKQASRVSATVPIDRSSAVTGTAGEKASSSRSAEHATFAMLHEEGYGEIKDTLRRWLGRHGVQVIPNSGLGRNNCLVISLLQHATGRSPAAGLVEKYKAVLAEDGIGENDPLLPSDEAFETLLKAINVDSGRDMQVIYIQAANDEPPFRLLESAAGSDPVAIWDQLGHYEALI